MNQIPKINLKGTVFGIEKIGWIFLGALIAVVVFLPQSVLQYILAVVFSINFTYSGVSKIRSPNLYDKLWGIIHFLLAFALLI